MSSMMHLYLKRFAFGRESTGSVLFIGGELICFTLEDQVREGVKVPGETAISYGTFELGLRTVGGFHNRYTQRFAGRTDIKHVGMIEILNVPDFEYILFHCGNDHEDTDGCILTGRSLDLIENGNYWLGQSEAAYIQFYNKAAPHLAAGNRALLHVEKFNV